jgi:hypothetical protein
MAHPGTETSCPASEHSTYSLDNIQLYAELYFGIHGRGMFEGAAHDRKFLLFSTHLKKQYKKSISRYSSRRNYNSHSYLQQEHTNTRKVTTVT